MDFLRKHPHSPLPTKDDPEKTLAERSSARVAERLKQAEARLEIHARASRILELAMVGPESLDPDPE